jgi:hypothetical protein
MTDPVDRAGTTAAPQGADVHPTWLEELVRDRIAGLHQAADRRIRHITQQPDHGGAVAAAPTRRQRRM